MELYRIEAKPAPHGWTLCSPAFGVTVDAGEDELDRAVQALRALIADEAQKRLDRGDFLPQDDAVDAESLNGGMALYLETDFGNRFAARTSETVRRNISMPAWMDLRLRRNGVDASRLFQEAAAARLSDLERAGCGARKVSDVQDLLELCPGDVLDDYFRMRMKQVVTDGMKRKGD